jgi:putative ABC transport system permease protein
MLFLTKLAFKNLARHMSRTLITAVIIAFATFFYIVMDSLVGGMTEMSYETIIDYEAGHLQISNEEYWEEEEKLPLKNLFSVDGQMMTAIRNIPGYIGSSPELSFQARLNNGSDELPVIGRGVIPEAFEEVFALGNQFVEGSLFTSTELFSGESPVVGYQAVLGKRLAELMELELGDYIILLVKDRNETFNTIEAQICGLVHTSNLNVNQYLVYLPLAPVQEALSVGNEVSKVVIRMENKNLATGAAVKLENHLRSHNNYLGVYPWSGLEAISFAEAQNIENQVILTIILLIAAIAIINTVILAALERREEIGMMKAMGLQNNEVVYTFVLESIGIGILGGVIGVLMGIGGVWMMITYGLDFEAMFGMDMASFGMPVIGKVYGVWNPAAFVKVVSFGIIVSFLASIWPAYRAADKDPVKTIYHR